MIYKLLKGEEVDISLLPREDVDFILGLYGRALNSEDYFDLMREVCGPGAYPLKGSPRVTREVHGSLLYQVAEDIADRVGIGQGAVLPDEDDEMVPTEAIMGAEEASARLGISRSAVVRAAQLGKIRGKKIGRAWALLRESVDSYEVSEKRVAAGRKARRRSTLA